ncbi:MAG: YceI family protein [Cyclobacteriaceae bacterium]|nr:YceI family protein [Cyclobacteriaceae bacterium]
MNFILVFILLGLYSDTSAQTYLPIDATSEVSFKIKNFGSTVDGTFKGLNGTIDFDPANLSNAKFDVAVNATTIDTGIRMRDNHLRKADYFGVADFSTIRFVSTGVVVSRNPNELILTGKLTIKKTTKEITFPFGYSASNVGLQFKGQFKINRRDFGVGGNSFNLSDEVTVMLDVKTSK